MSRSRQELAERGGHTVTAAPRSTDGVGSKAAASAADLLADGLMTVAEATTFLSVSRSGLYLMMDRGELPYVKLGRSRRIPRRAVIDLASQGLRGGLSR